MTKTALTTEKELRLKLQGAVIGISVALHHSEVRVNSRRVLSGEREKFLAAAGAEIIQVSSVPQTHILIRLAEQANHTSQSHTLTFEIRGQPKERVKFELTGMAEISGFAGLANGKPAVLFANPHAEIVIFDG